MNPLAVAIADNSFRAMLSDACWQAFGYRSKPSQGLMDSIFKPVWKRLFEARLTKELFFVHVAAQLVAIKDDRESLTNDVFEFCRGDDGRFEATFGIKRDFLTALSNYTGVSLDKWSDVLIDNLQVKSLPDHTFSGRLLVHTIFFAQRLVTFRMMVELHGVDMSKWPKPQSEEEWARDKLKMASAVRS